MTITPPAAIAPTSESGTLLRSIQDALRRAEVSTVVFTATGSERQRTVATFSEDDSQEFSVVNVYPDVQYQTLDGFGGAITEATAYTFSLLSPADQERLLDLYFGDEGARYSIVRTHIDSCDFSLDQYEALGEEGDDTFASFSMQRDERYILPMLRRAQQRLGRPLSVMLSPWSPPAFMKTNGSRTHGGSLRPEYRAFWARYLVRYVQEYRARGFDVTRLSIQNEPNATQIWDSCRYTAGEEKVFLRDFLHPELERAGFSDVGVHIWDHNKERAFERARAIIDDETATMVAGLAFHWYTGDHFDALTLVRERYPDLKLVFSEGCVEYSRFEPSDSAANAAMYAHDIIGNIAGGMNAFIDWNMLLDAEGGPNHVSNFCAAAMMVDGTTGELAVSSIYDVMAEVGRTFDVGARRVATTRFASDLDVAAVVNPDGSVGILIHSRRQAEQEVVIRLEGSSLSLQVPARSLTAVRTGTL
jgi:glucosylceramidase